MAEDYSGDIFVPQESQYRIGFYLYSPIISAIRLSDSIHGFDLA
jgi:hypothetical protein